MKKGDPVGGRKRTIWAFANTPFQVICIAELCNRIRRLRESESLATRLLIIGTPRANTTQSSRSLARSFSLEHSVLRLPLWIPSGVVSLVYLLVCRWRLREARPGDILIVGNAMHHRYVDLLARSERLERWSVDDGTASIYLLRTYALCGNPLRGVIWDKGFYKFIARYLFRVKVPDWGKINWFTIFYPEFKRIPNITHNQLRHIKKLGSQGGAVNEIWFMGAALIEGGIVTPGVFSRVIWTISQRIRDRCPGMVLRYVLHPDEKRQRQKYTKAYEVFDECVYFGEPIESVIASAHSAPAVVVSILSTSIITMRELLPRESEVIVYLLNESDVLHSKAQHVQSIMEFLENACNSRGIEVNTLPSLTQK